MGRRVGAREGVLRGIGLGAGFLGVCVAVFGILFSVVGLRRASLEGEKTRRLNGGASTAIVA
jgi:hypothetical protein